MTTPDDDQELVTIRVPRRAAALFAAEMDVASSPWIIKVDVYGSLVASYLGFVAAVAALITGVVQIINANPEFATTCFISFAIASVVSSFMLAVSLRRFRTAKQRGLL